MIEPIDATQPINIFFQRIDRCVQYADDGQVAFTAKQILQMTYHAVSTLGYYNDACKEWRKTAAINKTWLTFKMFFAAKYHDIKEQQKVNTSQNNLHIHCIRQSCNGGNQQSRHSCHSNQKQPTTHGYQ
jgi:hypothetical protein